MLRRTLLVCCLAALLGACANLTPDFDPPQVSVESIDTRPDTAMGPSFEIGLRVTNPNKEALDIAGVAYDIEILGKDLVSGVSNSVPRIEGYSDAVFTLTAHVNWLGMLQLFTRLGQEPPDEVDYRFKAKIDFEGFVPTQRVEETGTFSLNPPR
ncbi:MAG: LEA type 2 family protein [Pseudomonadota bacterium]